jgi:hypothetical protein
MGIWVAWGEGGRTGIDSPKLLEVSEKSVVVSD